MPLDAPSIINPAPTNGGPWWSKMVTQWGPVTVAFLLMLGFLLTQVYTGLSLANNKLDGLFVSNKAHDAVVEEIRRNTNEQVYLLRLICSGVWKTDDARARCNSNFGYR